MKRKLVSVLLCAAMVATLLAGCGSEDKDADTSGNVTDDAGEKKDDVEPAGDDGGVTANGTYALVTKAAGNPYNEKEAEGFQKAIEEIGGTAIIKHPEEPSASAQIEMINELVAQGVDSISIAGNDFDALQPALKAAMDAGIKVNSLDSNVNADSRMVFVNQAGIDEVGETLMDAVLDIAGGEGEWAILSATSQAANQNAWIASMKKIMEDDKYADLKLVDVAYGDDVYQKSVDQTQALLENYPDLKVICAPTTVGIMAAAKVLQDKGVADKVKLTGLGLPSEMADYIGDGDDSSCPYMYLWNPIDVGRLSAYVAVELVAGNITGAVGDKLTYVNDAGETCDVEIVETSDETDDGTEVIVGPPFKFEPSNIDKWKSVY